MTENSICIVDNHHGVYIPKMFAERWNTPECFKNYREVKEDLDTVECGTPDTEEYWDAWQNIIDNARFCPDQEVIMDATVYHLMEGEGAPDLFAVPENELEQL